MFELEKWEKHDVGDKLTRKMARHNPPSGAPPQIKQKKRQSVSSPMDEERLKKSSTERGFGQASLKNRKKNLKESRRRKRKKIQELAEPNQGENKTDDRVHVDVDSEVSYKLDRKNRALVQSKVDRVKLKCEMKVGSVEVSEKSNRKKKRKSVSVGSVMDECEVIGGEKRKRDISGSKQPGESSPGNSDDPGSMRVPKKSKRNKYFHMTTAYQHLSERSIDSIAPEVERRDATESKRKKVVVKKSSDRNDVENCRIVESEVKLKSKRVKGDVATTGTIESTDGESDLSRFKHRKLKRRMDDGRSEGDKCTNLHLLHNLQSSVVVSTDDVKYPKDTIHLKYTKNDSKNSNPPTKSGHCVNKVPQSGGSSLVSKMEERLSGARFRYINEQLYSCSGGEALQMFRDDDSLFDVYHHGYENQVARWPVNPLDVIIKAVKLAPKTWVIADFGCGAAKLASKVKQSVHSFDLVALNDDVIAGDMANVPLSDECVNMAVFCLSLMGTNIADYIREANRVLKLNGQLKIAEVASRITKLHPFLKTMLRLGFTLDKRDTTNTMFVILDFIKTSCPKATQLQFTLPPCVYKPR